MAFAAVYLLDGSGAHKCTRRHCQGQVPVPCLQGEGEYPLALPPWVDFKQAEAKRRKRELKLQALPAQGRVLSFVLCKIVKKPWWLAP